MPERKQEGAGERRAQAEAGRRSVEALIDEIVDDTFPASDPPAWGVAAARLERARRADGAPS
jgi:hypothetical protein